MGVTSPLSASALADKATSLTSGFVTATNDNMEQVFAEYDTAIAQMEKENPLQAEQFSSTYGTLIQDWRNAIAGGKPEEIEKAKRAFQQAVRQNQSQNEDWFPEYMKYIEGLSSLSEATRLETMDDRVRELQNARYYADQFARGEYITPEGYQALAARYNISEMTLREKGRTDAGRRELSDYMYDKDKNASQGMAEALLDGMKLEGIEGMTFYDAESFANKIRTELGAEGEAFAQRVLDYGITIVNGVLGIDVKGIKTETQSLGEMIEDQLKNWQKDTYTGP